METILEYYLPGLQHRQLTDEAFAQKLAHLAYIHKEANKKTE
jgi:hypothetical protein